MKKRFSTLNHRLLALALFASFLGCHKEEVMQEQKPQPLNSFGMRLDGQEWQPTQIGEEVCMQAFNGEWSSLTENNQEKPFYTIQAYKNPQAPIYKSENAFQFQIMNVKKPGLYRIDGSYL